MRPSWSKVKTRLAGFDRAGLIGLIQDLYAANKDTQNFLHTRFDLSPDVLKPYKTTIQRWLWPEVMKHQDVSVSKAKKAIADYRKALGLPEGMIELMVFYCEQASGFSQDIGLQDESYFDALIRIFTKAMEAIQLLPDAQRQLFWDRLNAVRTVSHDFGYGVGDDMDEIFEEYAQG
ncbi:MAG: hypothetical protein ABI395_05870 [Sphingobium sp.]